MKSYRLPPEHIIRGGRRVSTTEIGTGAADTGAIEIDAVDHAEAVRRSERQSGTRFGGPRPSRWFGADAGIGPVAALLGAAGWLFTFIGSWIPAFWGDEAASVMSAERPLATIWRELGRVDAVHGAYYLFLHFWIDAFGASELSVRLPSTIAAGVAVAGTVVLAHRLFARSTSPRAVAVVAGLVMILLPRVSYMAAEGRSYAIGTAVATWLTVLFVTLLQRRVTRRLPWIGFALLFAASIYVFLYLVLLAVVFAVALLAARPGRAVIRRWFSAVTAGVLLAAPVIVYALGEHGQISFLDRRNYVTFTRMFVIQWFGNPWLALACWALIVVAVVALIRSRDRAVALLLGWVVLPMGLLIFGNAVVAPMYTIRYLSFCTPAVSILVAFGVCALFSRGAAAGWIRAAAVLALLALALPTDVFQRTEFAKDGGSDLRQAAQVIGSQAKAGDAVVFDETAKPSRKPRLALHLYPQYFTGLSDVTLRTPYTQRSGIWDSVWPIAAIAPSLQTTSTVWDLELVTPGSTGIPANIVALERLGYSISRQIPVHRTVVYELTRETP
ncbi:glycosyltransferase family 39 protein [soil metagenome]